MSRIDDLKKDPFLFNQAQHGCCGFATIIMSMLEHDQSEFDALKKCVQGIDFYKNIPGAKISNRIKKRIDLGLLNTEDNKLSIGLMIIFKEIFGKNSKVWQDCIKYSENFGSWAYTDASKGSGKLKAMVKADVTPKLQFSYKHGDLALPLLACGELLKAVYGKKLKTAGLHSMTAPSAFNPPYAAIPSLTRTGIEQVQKYVQSNSKRGAILGLAKAQEARNDKLKPYTYIVHWVYVPYVDNKDLTKPMTVWSWGDRYSWESQLFKQKNLIPMMAITFELK